MGRARRLLALLIPLVAVSATRADATSCVRVFASIGGSPAADRMRIDPAATENAGHESARFWQSADSGLNNFGGSCPSQDPLQLGGGWWQVTQTTLRGVEGMLGESGCSGPCFSGDMTLVVEERGAVPTQAYFIALRVDPTPGGERYWDLSRVDPSPSPSVLTMQPYPRPEVTSAAVGSITFRFPDIADGVHSVGMGDAPLPASSVVAGYSLYRVYGPDPGRDASLWTRILDVPYMGAQTEATVPFECPPSGADVRFALGLSFEGGAGPDVASVLVGQPLAANCGILYPPLSSGAVPDGSLVAGEPLRLAKAGAEITLTWDHSCFAGDIDFAVYEGQLGTFTSHDPRTCSTGGALEWTLEPADGDRYFLVVPLSTAEPGWSLSEGSYGRRSDGAERPQNLATACRYGAPGGCP